MRYPVGLRPTLDQAHEAASESATMTGLKYHVMFISPRLVERLLELGMTVDDPAVGMWQFAPVQHPDPRNHEPVRV